MTICSITSKSYDSSSTKDRQPIAAVTWELSEAKNKILHKLSLDRNFGLLISFFVEVEIASTEVKMQRE